MAKVMQADVPLEVAVPVPLEGDEEVGNKEGNTNNKVPVESNSKEEASCRNEKNNSLRSNFRPATNGNLYWLLYLALFIVLVVGLCVGLTRQNREATNSTNAPIMTVDKDPCFSITADVKLDQYGYYSSLEIYCPDETIEEIDLSNQLITDPTWVRKRVPVFCQLYCDNTEEPDTKEEGENPNLDIFDKAVELIEATPRQYKELPSGETISYREYNEGQAYKLVLLPGYMADDTSASILAVLPEFHDHHIIAVNPIGWNGSTMNTPIYTHEENADEVMELIKLMDIEQAMVGGYSTGGGIAFYLAKKYPETFPAAFLMHSILLQGMNYLDENGKPITLEEAGQMLSDMITPEDIDGYDLYEMMKVGSTNPNGFPPNDHKLVQYFGEASMNMPGAIQAMVANVGFNITPIRTPYAEPSDALEDLQSKVIILHSPHDTTVPGDSMEHVTKLAIADQWAPPDKLFYYDDGGDHMILMNDPRKFASVYRKALEEQVLN